MEQREGSLRQWSTNQSANFLVLFDPIEKNPARSSAFQEDAFEKGRNEGELWNRTKNRYIITKLKKLCSQTPSPMSMCRWHQQPTNNLSLKDSPSIQSFFSKYVRFLFVQNLSSSSPSAINFWFGIAAINFYPVLPPAPEREQKYFLPAGDGFVPVNHILSCCFSASPRPLPSVRAFSGHSICFPFLVSRFVVVFITY